MRLIAILVLSVLLAACGQTGPLYMPGAQPTGDDSTPADERQPEDGIIN